MFKYKCTLKCSMVIKSLTITEDAYDALKRLKYGKESFSDVIIRMSKEKVGLSAKFFGSIKMTEKEVKEWKENIKKRREDINREFEDRSKKIRSKL